MDEVDMITVAAIADSVRMAIHAEIIVARDPADAVDRNLKPETVDVVVPVQAGCSVRLNVPIAHSSSERHRLQGVSILETHGEAPRVGRRRLHAVTIEHAVTARAATNVREEFSAIRVNLESEVRAAVAAAVASLTVVPAVSRQAILGAILGVILGRVQWILGNDRLRKVLAEEEAETGVP